MASGGGGVNRATTTDNIYGAKSGNSTLDAGSVGNAGAGQGHDNMQPYLAVNFCIALQGLFPSRN